MNYLVGGWQVGGITYLRTGQPFSPAFTATQTGWLGNRPDQIGNPNLSGSERSEYRWFDASAFATPAPFTYGNAARNMLFGPGDIVVDLSILKTSRSSSGLSYNFGLSSSICPITATWAVPGRTSRSPHRLAALPAPVT